MTPPKLRAYRYQDGLSRSCRIFLYKMGSEMFGEFMEVESVLASINAEIEKLEQARKLLAGSSVSSREANSKERGR